MRIVLISVMMATVLTGMTPAKAGLLGEEWISEAEMKRQSAFARKNRLVLMDLQCRFREGAESPGRDDVEFRADFEQSNVPVAWGWTFDANAALPGPEKQARAAGLEIASEDYFEISGVTWVRCRVWKHP